MPNFYILHFYSNILSKLCILGAAAKECPIDYPFAFNYGKGCCYFDKDYEGSYITKRSKSCWYDAYRPCTDGRCLDNGISF